MDRAAAHERGAMWARGARFVLPVSGAEVRMRPPTGREDLLLAEAEAPDAALALALAQRLGRAEGIEWGALAVSDLDALVLRLRQALIGDRVRADVTCHAAGCGCRIDISFGINAYLAHHRPRRPPLAGRGWSAAACADAPGWFEMRLRGGDALRFRLPSADDLIAVAARADAEAELARRCLRPADAPAPLRRAAEAAMRALAPDLAGDLAGRCPECGARVTVRFEPRRYCLTELRDRARFLFADVDALAQRYHWSERAILRMPNARRMRYAELARQAEAA
jgi:hypothetical protein